MKELLHRVLFSISYYVTWVLYFIVARAIFLVYNYHLSEDLSTREIIETFTYGLRLDASFSAYISLIPLFIVALSVKLSISWIKSLIKIFTYSILLLLNLLLLVDAGLYEHWGIKIDTTAFQYIDTPSAMLASLTTSHLIVSIIGFLLLSFSWIYIFRKLIEFHVERFEPTTFKNFIPLLLLTASLIIPLRGGLQTMPVNQSNVYFSKKMFANHAAVNFAWNFAHSLSKTLDNGNPYVMLDHKVARNIIEESFEPLRDTDTAYLDSLKLLSIDHPNIIIITWESLTAKIVESLNGVAGVTPQLDSLVKEGLLFTNFYANGERSDKGITSILSGYYPQPEKSIIKIPAKSRTLYSLPQALKKEGYHTSFYYGGDLNFGNLNTYLIQSELDTLISGADFSKKDWNSKWGVHDHVMLDRFLDDINKENHDAFFKMLFTLSSHEPFEFPRKAKFGMKDKIDQFKSSHYYTDEAIGDFISKAKQEDWWDDSIIIILADHGHPLPRHNGYLKSSPKFHIPMLWLGGALGQKNKKIHTYCSQTDLAYTLLKLLHNKDADVFSWSKNIFDPSQGHFAHYIFNSGYGTLNDSSSALYDYRIKTAVEQNEVLQKLGASITQEVYQDFLTRGTRPISED